MESQEQRAIRNRANAQKSTGPKTEAGKQRSAKNSFKHGRRASFLKNFIPPHAAVLCNEDRQRYFRLQERLIAKYQPHDPTEAAIVKKITNAEWRGLMIDELFSAFQNKALMDIVDARQKSDPEIGDLLLELQAFEGQAGNPGVQIMHDRLRKAIDRTIAANERRLILLRKHFPSVSTAIERRDVDREKREYYRSHPELLAGSLETANEATNADGEINAADFELVEQ
jgi:hypothetical protein